MSARMKPQTTYPIGSTHSFKNLHPLAERMSGQTWRMLSSSVNIFQTKYSHQLKKNEHLIDQVRRKLMEARLRSMCGWFFGGQGNRCNFHLFYSLLDLHILSFSSLSIFVFPSVFIFVFLHIKSFGSFLDHNLCLSSEKGDQEASIGTHVQPLSMLPDSEAFENSGKNAVSALTFFGGATR